MVAVHSAIKLYNQTTSVTCQTYCLGNGLDGNNSLKFFDAKTSSWPGVGYHTFIRAVCLTKYKTLWHEVLSRFQSTAWPPGVGDNFVEWLRSKSHSVPTVRNR
jgi:hypothetical protein